MSVCYIYIYTHFEYLICIFFFLSVKFPNNCGERVLLVL